MQRLFNPEAFGSRVTRALEARGVTLREAADQIGVPKATLHRVTRGGNPDVENFLRITAWLDFVEKNR